MGFRDIQGFVFSAETDEPVLKALEAFGAGGAYATATLLGLQPDPVLMAGGVFGPSVWAQVGEQFEEMLEKDRSALEARCKKAAVPIATRVLTAIPGAVDAAAAVYARHAELSVMLRPDGSWLDDSRTKLFEGLLFGSGRPVVLVPEKWSGGAIGRRVAVGWNGKREAARALSDSMPFLRDAEEVSVITVDARPDFNAYGEAPGLDITAHLARCGVKATLRNVDGLGRENGEALLAEALEVKADLIVIGGYGRARLSEFVFGGVTRSLSRVSDIPVLMSH